MVYLKLDLTNNKIQQALSACASDFAQDYPDNVLSVNINAAGTLAWVKLAREPNNVAPYGRAILDTQPNNQAALQDCYTPGWYPEE